MQVLFYIYLRRARVLSEARVVPGFWQIVVIFTPRITEQDSENQGHYKFTHVWAPLQMGFD